MRLYYDERGLDRYFGLLELGEIGGLWKNVAGRYEIDGKKVYAKAIYKDPESYFTPEVMEKLDEIAKEEFSYGYGNHDPTILSRQIVDKYEHHKARLESRLKTGIN